MTPESNIILLRRRDKYNLAAQTFLAFCYYILLTSVPPPPPPPSLPPQESGCARSWLHKGLIVNLGFLVVMVVGVVLGEVLFPLQGVRGRGVPLENDTRCINETPAGQFPPQKALGQRS